ncbi:hypothetical protein JQ615_00240 [Bradyrhizobium jicamae]|uniref:Uncharacterized protein n=1 Tax=Bradyrhizobium jicamae TaxID=280332 RepID=A0ABS5FAQ0_9BRAD|nr:hypothetical protein [Bradyrhizobium jicamae]MBR0793812.1 hypothetical protein [Bradyrhizobium jicamae]MBR0933414.1 hypothetical protein [Bradyrhizobium jicamae]
MRPTTALHDNVVDLNAIIHPGTVFEHPRYVVSHPSFSLFEKRAILASWASDASAIASCPSLRAPEGLKAPISIDEILALRGPRRMRMREDLSSPSSRQNRIVDPALCGYWTHDRPS